MITHFGYFEPFWQLLHLRNVFYQSNIKLYNAASYWLSDMPIKTTQELL